MTEEATKTRNNQQYRPYSQPQLTRTITLKTGIAQNVYARVAHRFAQSLFNLDVIMRISFSDIEMMDAMSDQIDTEFKASNDLLDTAIEQIKVSARDAGIDPDDEQNLPSYTQVQSYEVRMRTPSYGQFIKILTKLDYLTSLFEMMWLNGEVSSQFRLRKSREWQSVILRLANKIIAREKNARSAAEKKGDKEVIDLETMTQTEDINENDNSPVEKATAEIEAQAPASEKPVNAVNTAGSNEQVPVATL